jgi:uncharacterized repeat protein (TIGR01451 family)
MTQQHRNRLKGADLAGWCIELIDARRRTANDRIRMAASGRPARSSAVLGLAWTAVISVAGVLSAPAVVDAGSGVWTSGGPYGGSVSALVVDPASPAVVYAGTSYVGVFKSSDGGGTWAPASKGLTSLYVNALAIDPTTPTTLYAAGDHGVFKSKDAGGTWAAASTGLAYLYTTALAIDPTTPTTLYAGTAGGVFKSEDAGGTWAAASAGLTFPDVAALAIDPTTPTTLYVATAGGTFKSTDAAATWAPASTGLPYRMYVLAVSPSTPSTVYAGTGTGWGGVYRSTDGGAHWTAANVGVTDLGVSALAVDPSTASTVYAGTTRGGVYRSTDAGDTWVAVDMGLTGSLWTKALAIDPTSLSTIYAGMLDDGVLKSSDSGDHWTGPGMGLTGVDVRAVAVDRATPTTLYAGAGDQGVFKSTDAGGAWAPVNSGLPSLTPFVIALAIDPWTPATVYAGSSDQGVFKSIDSGGTWTASSVGLAPSVSALAIDPTNTSMIYAGTYDGIFKSTDSGGTWTPARAGMPRWTSVGALVVDPTNSATLYAGTLGHGVFKSTDSGASWAAVTTGLTDFFVAALAIDPSRPATLYAGTRTGVFKSVNGGATWGFVGLNLSVSALAIDPTDPPTIYAATVADAGFEGGGVFRSTDGGSTWNSVNKGLLTRTIMALALDSSGPTTVYAAPWQASVWQATPPAGVDTDLALTLSDSPDPVIGTTTLTYSIAVSNAGPFSAGYLSVSHTLPAGVAFGGAWGSGWTCAESGGVVRCTRPDLAAGAAPVITVQVTPGPGATVLFSSAAVSAAESDPNPANNSASEATNVIAPLVWMGTRTKTVIADPGEFVIGGGVTYRVALTNAGPSAQPDNPGHELADILPASLDLVSADATTGTVAADLPGNAVTWDGSLLGGASVTVTIHARVRPTVALGAIVANQATLYYDADGSGTNEATALTDDPGRPGASDPTRFVVVSPRMDFFTVKPCRLVDTRDAPGAFGGPALVAGADRVFPLLGRCEIPATARALAVNLTVTRPTAPGNLRLYAAGTPLPLASSLNYSAGETRASNAVVSLNGLGELAVRCSQASGTAHFVLDVNGYFE